MGKKAKRKQAKTNSPGRTSPKIIEAEKKSILPLLFLVLGITGLCLSPMLQNGFTNWDDWDYVTHNKLLPGPDWNGILTKPVVGNYHPLTVISLALNYQLTQQDASSYLLVNFILHLLNTALVFYFIWIISAKRLWVAFFTALIFGIHPMHVESVAWVSERKDVLYSFFILLSLLQYWKFLQNQKRSNYWLCFLFFTLSLLSKPAAIIFPFVYLLLDYWNDRPLNKKLLLEKIPFFVLSLLFGIITLNIQSQSAVVTLENYPLWSRPLFGCYVLMIYFLRFFVPYPLSTFHPYPSTNDLPTEIYLAPFFVLALLAFIWYKRKNKLVVFGFLFFIVNLLLVLQVIAIGSSLVSERYTYIPYIGLSFTFAMLLAGLKNKWANTLFWLLPVLISIVFGYISFQRTKVWRDSNTLWTDVIKKFPKAPLPRTNRANNNIIRAVEPANKTISDSLYKLALEDCNIALINKPDHISGLENRQNIYLNQGRNQEALADANALIKLEPENKTGYFTRGLVYYRTNQPDKALADFNKSLSLDPNAHFTLVFRGLLYLNYLKKYPEALADLTKAITINPQANYYLNRSYCYFHMGDKTNARSDAQVAIQKGMTIPEDYRKSLNL